MKLFAGSSNPGLAREIAAYLRIDLGKCVLDRFSDGEIHFYIDENVRGEDIFVLQSGSHEANFNLMELFIMIDAFKRASADRITAVIPYYGYARQDWKDRPRVPITARLDGRSPGNGRGRPGSDDGSSFAPDPGLFLRPGG